MATIEVWSRFQELSARLVVVIDSGANCYFPSTKIFNNKSIMSTDVFNLNELCPAILLDTELRIYNGFYFPVPYWNLVCTGVLCVYTVGALGVCVKMILCCGHPVRNSQSNFGRAITDIQKLWLDFLQGES